MTDMMTAPLTEDDHAEDRAKTLLARYPPGRHRRVFEYGLQPHSLAPHVIVCKTYLPHAQHTVEEGLRVSGPEFAFATLSAIGRLARAYYHPGDKTVEIAAVEDLSGVDHPTHYNSHPSGVECITIVEHFSFNLGNAMKYVWHAGLKAGSTEVDDLRKAVWYLNREIDRLIKE